MLADFADRDVIADPYPVFRDLQRQAPIHFNEGLQAWCVTRYADVQDGFRAPFLSADRIQSHKISTSFTGNTSILQKCLSLWMVFNDPPNHTRLRALVTQAFSRRALESLRPSIKYLANELIDDLGEDFDVIGQFAYPLPASVIAEMLAVPREDVPLLKQWSDDLASFVLVSRLNAERHLVAAESLQAMTDYFARLIDKRRRIPGEKIIDILINCHDKEERLTAEELVSSCVLLLFAGHETTTHFIANGLRALILHPVQLEQLRARADHPAFLTNALHELLRWDGPSLSQPRIVSHSCDWLGCNLSKSERVYLFIAAANRDPSMFVEPDELLLDRTNASKQLAFGSGIHVCLGAHLARLEGEIAFPLILERLSGLTLKPQTIEWNDNLVIRGMKRLLLSCRDRIPR